MYNDEYYRFITDEEGKALVSQFYYNFGWAFTATTDTFNHLDGRFTTNTGDIVGLEVKNMSMDRYTKYDDILIAADKYEYASNKGKIVSGLTDSVKFDYVKVNSSTIIVMITRFSAADGKKPKWKYMPIGNCKGAPKKWQLMYSVPRSRAKKYKITDGKIERM